MTIDRREFLRRLLAASGLAVSEPLLLPGQQSRRIIIVGAGLSGLVAAHELVNSGNQVTILEAQPRPGGRVYTLRDPFSDGLYAEAGALRIPQEHDLTRMYAAEFGLKLVPFQPDQASQYTTEELKRQAGGAMGNAFNPNSAAYMRVRSCSCGIRNAPASA